MLDLQNGFFSNNSKFGRIMTKIDIVVCTNLMFIVFSLPVITIGASWTALCYVMMKMLRTDMTEDQIHPWKLFWIGFKTNFKQATIIWIVSLAIIVIGIVDVRICQQAGGVIGGFRYPIYIIGFLLVSFLIYLFPTMAAFDDTVSNLVRNSFYFIMHRPWKLLIIAFVLFFPLYHAYIDLFLQPMYAFFYAFFGFGLTALLTAWLLLADFKPYLKSGSN